MTDYAEVLDAMRPFRSEDIYCVGPFAQRVSFSGQQYRAFALLHALYCERAAGRTIDKRKIFRGQRFAVIGCSITGMTIAAGLSKMGADVRIFEKSSAGNHYLFNSNQNRFVHPNINFIPLESLSFTTDLPFMYWWADSASSIYKYLYDEIIKCGLRDKIYHNAEVKHIAIDQDRDKKRRYTLAISKEGGDVKSDLFVDYNKIVICTGFASERDHPQFSNQSYWKLFRDMGSVDNFCILGKGDGGIIDAIYYGCEWTTENIFHSAMRFDEELRKIGEKFSCLDVADRNDENQLQAVKDKISWKKIFSQKDKKKFRRVTIFGFLDRSKPSPAVWHRFVLSCASKERFIKEVDLGCLSDFVKKETESVASVEYRIDKERLEKLDEKSTIVEVRLGADHDVSVVKETYLKNPDVGIGQGPQGCVDRLRSTESAVSGLIMSRRELWASDSDFMDALFVDNIKKRTDAKCALNAWMRHCRIAYCDDYLDVELEDFGKEYVVYIIRSTVPDRIKKLPGLNGKLFNFPVKYSDIPDPKSGGVRNGLAER